MNADTNSDRAEATIRFTVDNISALSQRALSPAVYVRNLPWKLLVLPGDRSLGFFVQCNGEDDSPTWSCQAEFDLRVISYKENVPPFSRSGVKHLFNADENDYGYGNFIVWPELENPEKGYIRNNAVTLEAHIVAEPPIGLS